ncbi:MAG TPA: hypothetical protein DCQ14_04715 [Firmicutes bacterium]|nr:hypothetical protein [Bacillota bacterium]
MDERGLIYGADPRAEGLRSGKLKSKRKLRDKRLAKAISVIIILLLWAGLVYGGYYLAWEHLRENREYFTSQVEELKRDNRRMEEEITGALRLFQGELENYRGEIQQIRDEMGMIQEELELTGESIIGTDETRRSIQKRMAELDSQLGGLKEQLRKLEESVRAL